MGQRDVFDYRQPKPGAAQPPVSSLVYAVEALEYAVMVLRRDAASVWSSLQPSRKPCRILRHSLGAVTGSVADEPCSRSPASPTDASTSLQVSPRWTAGGPGPSDGNGPMSREDSRTAGIESPSLEPGPFDVSRFCLRGSLRSRRIRVWVRVTAMG